MINKYGVWGVVKLTISWMYTKLFFSGARLIRLPFDIRNRRFIKIGERFTTGFGCRVEAHPLNKLSSPCILIGSDVQINDYVHIAAAESVVIGDGVLIASKVYISDINHGLYKGQMQSSPLTPPNKRDLSSNPVIIEKNVWIGEGVCVMPGAIIGSGSIIGAMSVVTKHIPPNSIAVGNPAKVIKVFNFGNNSWQPISSSKIVQ